MGFFDFIQNNKNSDWKKTLIRDMTILTAVDGDINENEIELIYNIALDELGFAEKDFSHLINNLDEVKDIYPSSAEDKLAYLVSLINITYADGILDDNEVDYMKIIARRMSLPENAIDKALNIVETSFTSEETSNTNEGAYYDDSSIGKTIITSSFEPKIDVQSEASALNYLDKISKLSSVDLCIELSNVMSAKHNLTAIPSGIDVFSKTQKLVTDLTDKALIIFMEKFGREIILKYSDGDIRKFNQLVNDIDMDVARLDLAPAHHGKTMFDKIYKILGV